MAPGVISVARRLRDQRWPDLALCSLHRGSGDALFAGVLPATSEMLLSVCRRRERREGACGRTKTLFGAGSCWTRTLATGSELIRAGGVYLAIVRDGVEEEGKPPALISEMAGSKAASQNRVRVARNKRLERHRIDIINLKRVNNNAATNRSDAPHPAKPRHCCSPAQHAPTQEHGSLRRRRNRKENRRAAKNC